MSVVIGKKKDNTVENIENNIENKMLGINDLYSRIIQNHILELLRTINSKYPTKFPKTIIKSELENIMSNVNLSRHSVSTTKISSSSKPKAPSTAIKPKLDPAARCHARIWDDIFDRVTFKQVADIDDEFQVSDFNDINIKKFSKKYILGKQCARKKTADTNYCLLHNRHRPHGSYLEQPSKELCFHFMIDGGYLELEKAGHDE
jgi:hypothetical protein